MRFEREIEKLKNDLHQMYNYVLDNLHIALDYYINSEELKKDLYIDDDRINDSERKLESLCMQILLKESVYSNDFRNVSGILEMIDCLERIGDNAYDIKSMADDLKNTDYPLPFDGVKELALLAEKMVKDGFTSVINEDVNLAKNIIAQDDIVDDKYWKLVLNLAKLNDDGKIDGKATVFSSHILKYLERIADQATNIAEWVVYIKNGYHKDSIII